MKIIRPLSALKTLTIFLCFSVLLACDYMPFGYVSIADIVNNPTKYDGQKVKVKGVASDVTKIPFIEIKLYILSDAGYQITVNARDTVPAANSKVTVIGIVENVAIIGSESLGLHLREVNRVELPF